MIFEQDLAQTDRFALRDVYMQMKKTPNDNAIFLNINKNSKYAYTLKGK